MRLITALSSIAISFAVPAFAQQNEGGLGKGYKAWICVRDADTCKIRMEHVN